MTEAGEPGADPGQASPPAWRPLLPPPGPVTDALAAAGPGRFGTAMDGAAHLVVERADRQGAEALTVDPDGSITLGTTLPLRVVSGVAGFAGRLLVGGARAGSGVPVVCRSAAHGWDAWDLAGSGPPGAPVAAWPIPVAAADGPRVVWAAGAPPTITVARVVGDRPPVAPPGIEAGRVVGLQVAAAPGGVDVVWSDADGDRWQRLRTGGGAVTVPAAVPAGSTLVAGAVLTPIGGFRIAVLDPGTGARREIDLSVPPGAVPDDAAVDHVGAPAGEPGYLFWSIPAPTGHAGPAGAPAAPTRTFVARLVGWTVGTPVEVPGGARCVVAVDGRVLAFPTSGPPAWSIRLPITRRRGPGR